MFNVNILDHHRTVYEFLDLKNTPEIFNWWITKFGKQSFWFLNTLFFLLVNLCLYSETIFIIITALSVGSYQWIPDSWILNSMFDFSWSSLCTTNIWSMLLYVTWYCLIKVLIAIILFIESFLNHTYCLYPGTVALKLTTRVPPLPYTIIYF